MLRAIMSGAAVGLVSGMLAGLASESLFHEILLHVADAWDMFNGWAFEVVTGIRMELDPTFTQGKYPTGPIVVYSEWRHA